MTPSENLINSVCFMNQIGCAIENLSWTELAIWTPIALAVAFVASLAFDYLLAGVFWIAEKLFYEQGGAQ